MVVVAAGRVAVLVAVVIVCSHLFQVESFGSDSASDSASVVLRVP